MAALALRELVKLYGQQLVVAGVSLQISDRSFVALVGPSGCGKSTTLRMIAGLESISAGEIEIGDRVVNALPARKRDVAMVFQSYALYPHMSVRQNLSFGLRISGVPRAEIERRVNFACDVLELQPYLARKPAKLSGGQRQRVAMGRAIVREPAVFLFDEPLSNLDAKLRHQMRLEIKQLHRRLGSTVVYVTHDQVEAMTMADVIVVMRDGRIEQVGAPLAVFNEPANRFVAGFIGAPPMNFFTAQIRRDGALEVAGLGVLAPAAGGFDLPPAGASVCVGLRPEDLVPRGHGPRPGRALDLEATLQLSESLGNESLLFVQIGAQRACARMAQPRELRDGERLRLAANLDKVHVFDPRSGRSLRRPGAHACA